MGYSELLGNLVLLFSSTVWFSLVGNIISSSLSVTQMSHVFLSPLETRKSSFLWHIILTCSEIQTEKLDIVMEQLFFSFGTCNFAYWVKPFCILSHSDLHKTGQLLSLHRCLVKHDHIPISDEGTESEYRNIHHMRKKISTLTLEFSQWLVYGGPYLQA